MIKKSMTINNIKKIIRKLFGIIFRDHFKEHKIPFGPLAGCYIFMKPSISPRMYLGIDERKLANFAKSIIEPGDCIYDIGSHIGYTSILFSLLTGKSGRVEAFELSPRTAEICAKSMEINKIENCEVHAVGLGRYNENLALPIGATYMVSIKAKNKAGNFSNIEDCRVVKLDEYISMHKLNYPQVVKIDIEGAEVEALIGAHNALKTSEPILIIEFHSLSLLKEGIDLLNNQGYCLMTINGTEISAEVARKFRYYHQSLISYKKNCDWHQERLKIKVNNSYVVK